MKLFPQVIRATPRIALGKIPPKVVDVQEGPRGGLRYRVSSVDGKLRHKYLSSHEVLKCGIGKLKNKGGACAQPSQKPVSQQRNEHGKRYGRVIRSSISTEAIGELQAMSARKLKADHEMLGKILVDDKGSLSGRT